MKLLNKVTEDILKLVEPPYEVNSGEDVKNELEELMRKYNVIAKDEIKT